MNKIEENLNEQLNQLKVKDLRKICKSFNLNNTSNKKKEQLIEEVYQCLTNEKKLSMVIARMIDKEFNLLKTIIKNKNNITYTEDYYYLYELGIIAISEKDNNKYIKISDALYNTIKNINLDKFNKIIEENTNIYYLLKSMLELYGVVSQEDLEELYNKYYNKTTYYNWNLPMNPFYFASRLDRIESIKIKGRIYYVNKILTTEYFEDILANIIENHNKINRKYFSKQELLNYSDYSYYKETSSIKEFKHYLNDKGLSNKIDNIIINIINIFKLSPGNIEVAIKMLEEYNLKEIDNTVIKDYLTNIYDETILWQNNGWTTNELKNI